MGLCWQTQWMPFSVCILSLPVAGSALAWNEPWKEGWGGEGAMCTASGEVQPLQSNSFPQVVCGDLIVALPQKNKTM